VLDLLFVLTLLVFVCCIPLGSKEMEAYVIGAALGLARWCCFRRTQYFEANVRASDARMNRPLASEQASASESRLVERSGNEKPEVLGKQIFEGLALVRSKRIPVDHVFGIGPNGRLLAMMIAADLGSNCTSSFLDWDDPPPINFACRRKNVLVVMGDVQKPQVLKRLLRLIKKGKPAGIRTVSILPSPSASQCKIDYFVCSSKLPATRLSPCFESDNSVVSKKVDSSDCVEEVQFRA